MSTNKTKKFSNVKCTSIGGQAVLEGVMMKGNCSVATAVRDEQGVIRLETKRIKSIKEKSVFYRIPIIRGVLSFVASLFGGVGYLMRSAEVYGEQEPTKFEKWLAEKLKIDVLSVVGTIAVVLGLALAVFLFMWLPQTIRGLIEKIFSYKFGVWGVNLVEGAVKLLIFILYILLCSFVKDVKRTFMYHGAEHKTISCYEQGKQLTIENVKDCPRVHDRCGTTFMVFVLLISILVFACFESLIGQSVSGVIRVGLKLLLLPLVAGLSYELLKLLAKTNCFIFYPLKVPGLLLQKITTKEPDDKMIEVAIKAFTTVLEMDEDKTIQEVKFITPLKLNQLTKQVSEMLEQNGISDQSDAEWIVSISTGVKRSEVYTEKTINAGLVEKTLQLAKQRATGRPLWYCVGDTDFYGFTIKVDERVLIPRPETEILVENAIKYINSDTNVLDMCTGSGCIAISIQKQTNCKITASDISQDALDLAKENAQLNNANIDFIQGDLFENLGEIKFDVIVSNPPYIKKSDLSTLQKEVKDFEPLSALDGGEDGLVFYKRLASESLRYLTENGVLFAEIGYDQGESVKEIFCDFAQVEIIKDYEGNDRIIKAVR